MYPWEDLTRRYAFILPQHSLFMHHPKISFTPYSVISLRAFESVIPMHHMRTVLLNLLIILLLTPSAFAACTAQITLSVKNTQPGGYVYGLIDSGQSVNVTISPNRVWLQRDQTAVFTLTLTSTSTTAGSLAITFKNSGVVLERRVVPYTIRCPSTEPSPTRPPEVQKSQVFIHQLILLFTSAWILLLIALASWWKRRWIRREVIRILEIRRRKPVPVWLLSILILFIIISIVLLIILLFRPGISLMTSLFA